MTFRPPAVILIAALVFSAAVRAGAAEPAAQAQAPDARVTASGEIVADPCMPGGDVPRDEVCARLARIAPEQGRRFLRDEEGGELFLLRLAAGVPAERARWLSQHGIRVRVSGRSLDREGVRCIEVERILRAHDHDAAPHGGVVGMSGDRHLELVADAGGAIRVCVLDAFMQPVAVTGVTGSARIRDRAGNERRAGMRPDGECLVLADERRRSADDDVIVDLDVRGEKLGMTLPFAPSSGRKPHAHH